MREHRWSDPLWRRATGVHRYCTACGIWWVSASPEPPGPCETADPFAHWDRALLWDACRVAYEHFIDPAFGPSREATLAALARALRIDE